jgi:hypothetical protein
MIDVGRDRLLDRGMTNVNFAKPTPQHCHSLTPRSIASRSALACAT